MFWAIQRIRVEERSLAANGRMLYGQVADENIIAWLSSFRAVITQSSEVFKVQGANASI